MPEKKTRKGILNRFDPEPERAPRFHLQPRDQEIIRSVWQYKFLTAEQINQLHFKASLSAVNRRLKLLFHHLYLSRVYQPEVMGRKPAIYYLGKRAYPVLQDAFGIEVENPIRVKKDLTHQHLSHELAVSDFFLALTLATDATFETELVFWERANPHLNIRVLDSTESTQVFIPVQPDGFFGVRDRVSRKTIFYFLEMDMGTMRLGRIQAKLQGYEDLLTGPEIQAFVKQAVSRHELDLEGQRGGVKAVFVVPSKERQRNVGEVVAFVGLERVFQVRLVSDAPGAWLMQ